MGEGLFFERLRPNAAGLLNEGWTSTAYTSIDDAYTDPTVSGTADYIEAETVAGDDELWQGYAVANPTIKLWWTRIAKLDVHFLYYAHDVSAFKTQARINVSVVSGNVREGWGPTTGLNSGKLMLSTTYNAWTWGSQTFYPEEANKGTAGTDWTWEEWKRSRKDDIQIEFKSPNFKDSADAYFRIAVAYVDLYVFPSTGGMGGGG